MSQCKTCGQNIPLRDMRVAINGMYDMHLFEKFTGASVGEVAANWIEHCKEKHPAIVGDRKIDDLGPTALCPITVLGTNRVTGKDSELRRVGAMVHPNRDDTSAMLARWVAAAQGDPDISRILKENA